MSLYALIDGERSRATPDGGRRAACPDCGTRMIAKTGDVVIHHWAHETDQPHCRASAEGPWHLAWKSLGAEGTQEVAIGNRRADVLAPGGFAVEFQKSPMSPAEVQAREADWKHHLVWIFDARDAYAEGRLELRTHPDRDPGDAYRNIRWTHAPVRIKAATCRSLLDIDGERLVYVGKWFDSSPLRGYGWQVTQEWCVAYVVQGDRIHEPPGYRVAVDAGHLALRAQARLAKIRSWPQPAGRMCCAEPRCSHPCPLCPSEHPSCEFAAGSLHCTQPACRNPHHRPRTPAVADVPATRGAAPKEK